MSERRELIPERLRRHFDPMSTKNPLLPSERDVVEVLVESDLDRECERVASAACRALRSRSSFDAPAAAANVLLLLHLHEPIADLDEVDHFRLFELSDHRLEATTAARAHTIG